MSPETGQPSEARNEGPFGGEAELSLRERLALKAGVTADKMPGGNPLYEQGFGNGGSKGDMIQPSIVDGIGKKRRKIEDSSDEEEFKGARARDPPEQIPSKRAPARSRRPARQIVDDDDDSESSSVHFDDDPDDDDEYMGD